MTGRVRTLGVLMAVALVLTYGVSAIAADDPIELTVLHYWDGDRLGLVQKVIDDFMEQHPGIVVTQMPSPYLDHADRLMTLLLGGAAPDIVMVNGSLATPIGHMGGLVPLEDLIARDGIDLDMFIPPDLSGFELHGSIYALPAMSGIAWTNLMFYNKDMMNQAGLDPDDPPATWSDWRDASVRLTRRSPEGVLEQSGSFLPNGYWVANWNGAQLWSDDWRTATVNTPRAQEATMFLNDLFQAQYETSDEYRAFLGSGHDLAFYRSRMGFYFQNSSGFAHLKLFDIDFEWGAALAPVNDEHPDAKPMSMVTSTWAYAIPTTVPDEKMEAAWELLKWLTIEEDGGGWFARAQGRPSPVMSFNGHHEYTYENPYWHVVMESAQYVLPTPPVNVAVLDLPFVQAVRLGRPHQDALAEAEVRLQNELNAYWEMVE